MIAVSKLSPRLSAGVRSVLKLSLREIRWREHRWQFFIGLVFTLLTLSFFPRGQSFQFADLHEGDIYLGEQIISPFTFSINKTAEEYEHDQQLARESVYPVFDRRDSTAALQARRLQNFLTALESVLDSISPDSLKARRLHDIFSEHHTTLASAGATVLLQGLKRYPLSPKDFFKQLTRITRDLHSLGILNVERTALPAYVTKVSLRQGAREMVEDLSGLITSEARNNAVLQKLREIENIKDPTVTLGYQILIAFLGPNLFYEQAETDLRLRETLQRVPRGRGTVLQYEKILARHEKITREHLQKLKSLEAEKVQQRLSEGAGRWFLPLVGKFLIIALALTVLGAYLALRHDDLYTDLSKFFLIALILALVLFLAHLAHRFEAPDYLIPMALAPMLLTIFFGAQVGFVGTVTLSLMLGSLHGNDFGLAFSCLLIGAAGILAVRKVRSRSWIIKAIFYLGVAHFFIVLTMAFLLYTPFERLLSNLFYSALTSLFCPILTYGVMVILEYLFDVTTDATLLELSDLNRPLLHELALRAPGTYYHSILVGTLSEAAAEAIGANSLLARVGAYYHDIGKIEKPEYFVENQKGGKNPHEKLAPSMSCLVITNHVKRGLEIAESNGIPKVLRDFIPQHHGTNLVAYFYKKAQELSEDEDMQESTFRYPGPKPQTKETGILMLADAVEATVRAYREPSVSRIRHIVSGIVAERFTTGELDECPLTLRDLNKIKASFERTLTGIYHGRIHYPDDSKNDLPKDKRGVEQDDDSDIDEEAGAHA